MGDTGRWLPSRQVLLPPSALGNPDPAKREYPVDLSRERIEAAPGLKADERVSHQLETSFYDHYGWDPYWSGGYGYPLAGVLPLGTYAAAPPVAPAPDVPERKPKGDPNLRSANEVTGYYVEATDDSIGHVEDFMMDEEHWAVRYLLIDTRNWWLGTVVLISPHWTRDIVWAERKVFVNVARDKVNGAPEYDPSMALDRRYEEQLYGYYGYQPYWYGWT